LQFRVPPDIFAEVSPGPELTVVVPTFNERANVVSLVEELRTALADLRWEVIFVDDDSPDATAASVRELAATDTRVRCLQRINRRGLSSACVEGMLASSSPVVAVMDADLQHDASVLPKMLEVLDRDDNDVVVASRYLGEAGVGDWSRDRLMISRLATMLGRRFVPAKLTDPMSGFFVLRRRALDDVVRNLSQLGFKLLLDIFASTSRPLRYAEVPYVFRPRRNGDSKLDALIAWEYLMLLADKLVGRYVPVRFLSFAAIGAFGVLVHLAVLGFVHLTVGRDFAFSQTFATLVAMVSNYALNNELTYRDRRRRGFAWLRGLVSFITACSVGAFANVGIALYLFNRDANWLVSALCGIAVGVVWNYAVTGTYTWRRNK
jgi:dolichol-phosphate mannosyltransferase